MNQNVNSSGAINSVAIYKNPGLAAVLSFFWAGLGQIYNGQIAKGIFFIVTYAIAWILTFVLVGLIMVPILFIWGIYDAYKSAQKINRDIAYRSGAKVYS